MRRLFSAFVVSVISGLLLTGCLDEKKQVLGSETIISSFSIGDIKTKVTATVDGKDTTYTTTVEGEYYQFSIDHVKGLIYNTDSLPKGTDISAVTVSLNTSGQYVRYGENQQIYASSDSIDFRNPVRFTVYAYDGVGSKNYYVHLNVHQVKTDSLAWNRLADTDFPFEGVTELQALVHGDRLCVFALQPDGTPVMTGTLLRDGRTWSPLQCLNGLEGAPRMASALTLDDQFYLISGGKLYTSADGVEWRVCDTGSYTALEWAVPVDGKLLLRSGEVLVSGLPGDWQEVQTVDRQTFPAEPSVVSMPLKTNNRIVRSLLVGVPEEPVDAYAAVWAKLNTEQQWTHYSLTEQNAYGLPALQHLEVCLFDGAIYAFGGTGTQSDVAIGAFERMYKTTDGGITWKDVSSTWGFPEELLGFEGDFSSVTCEDGTWWIICSGTDGGIFRGKVIR